MSAAIGAALAGRAHDDRHLLAGPRADGRDRLHRRRDARADRDGASATARSPGRSTSTATTPTRCSSATPASIQLFAENAQEAYDLMVMAPRIAEHPDVLLPVLVCQDGFTITHSAEPVALLAGRGRARRSSASTAIPYPLLDLAPPDDAGPVRDARRLLRAPPRAGGRDGGRARRVFEEVAAEFAELTGRRYGALEPYRAGRRRARARRASARPPARSKDVVDELRDEGEPRRAARRSARSGRSRRARSARRSRGVAPVAVLDRADSPGGAPPLFAERRRRARTARRPRSRSVRLRPRRPRPPPGRRARGLRAAPTGAAASALRRPEERAVSRLKTLVRNERGTPAAARRPLALPGLRDPDGRAHGPRLDRDARGRRQRDRLPRGRDDALPDDRLERPLAARRVRERRRGRERRRERLPRARAGAARCRRTSRSPSSRSPATAAPTTSASRRSPARSSAATGSSSSATTTRRT